MNLTVKKELVARLNERLSKSVIVIAADYKGLDVGQVTELRSELTKAGVDFQVVKNTLLRRASENTDAALIAESYVGPTALAISYDDPVAPAKILSKFAETSKHFELKAAVMEGKAIDVNGIIALSKLPSKEILLGQLLSTMNAVPTSAVRLFAGIPRQMLNILQAIKEQREAD